MLSKTCDQLTGVGEAIANKLKKCGIVTLSDLIFHLPFRYQDRTRITPIAAARSKDYCVIAGKVVKTEIKIGKKRMLYCFVEDKSSVIRLRFFHFNQNQINNLKESHSILAFGEVKEYANQLEMIHPEYTLFQEGQPLTVEETLTPIYPLTEGLTQTRLRQLIKKALSVCSDSLKNIEWLSHSDLEELNCLPLSEAIMILHNPPPDISLTALEQGQHPALKRLIIEELLAQRLSLQLAKNYRGHLKAPVLELKEHKIHQFLETLPFKCTHAQHRVYQEISCDLNQPKPMLRMVQGDVGCGKTLIAALGMIQAVNAGFQVAFMAPTDILSEQHAQTLSKWLAPLGISVGRLSGKMKASDKKTILEQLAQGCCSVLVGTHALFQEGVSFAKLGLVIIDEQHRFGVEQRLLLQQKGLFENSVPHQLLLTATPIPRSLAMTHFSHIELSIIDELPPGRMPVQTAIIHDSQKDSIIERLKQILNTGKQAYWVCALIEESEKLQCAAATETANQLKMRLPEFKIGLVHGRLKSAEKESMMLAFKQGNIDLLVATTVIEVGVDVPNASLMIIENAERLGLSQLHQLRGRVGRGNNQSFCILLYQNPLSAIGRERLAIMKSTQDGFVIAEKDLELRGAGEFLGVKQTGYQAFKVADLNRDKPLLPIVASIAKNLMGSAPEVAKKIAYRWKGEFEDYMRA